MSQYLVSTIMRTDGPVVTRDMPIRTAVSLLVEQGAPAALVTREDGRLDGILTQKDCFAPALHASYHQEWTGSVADYMTPEAVTIDAGQDVVRAAEMFIEHPHRALPVLEGRRPAGLLHRSDVLRLLTRIG